MRGPTEAKIIRHLKEQFLKQLTPQNGQPALRRTTSRILNDVPQDDGGSVFLPATILEHIQAFRQTIEKSDLPALEAMLLWVGRLIDKIINFFDGFLKDEELKKAMEEYFKQSESSNQNQYYWEIVTSLNQLIGETLEKSLRMENSKEPSPFGSAMVFLFNRLFNFVAENKTDTTLNEFLASNQNSHFGILVFLKTAIFQQAGGEISGLSPYINEQFNLAREQFTQSLAMAFLGNLPIEYLVGEINLFFRYESVEHLASFVKGVAEQLGGDFDAKFDKPVADYLKTLKTDEELAQYQQLRYCQRIIWLQKVKAIVDGNKTHNPMKFFRLNGFKSAVNKALLNGTSIDNMDAAIRSLCEKGPTGVTLPDFVGKAKQEILGHLEPSTASTSSSPPSSPTS